MGLKDYIDRSKQLINERIVTGQAGTIDKDRNQHTGLTFTDVNNTYQIDKIYEDELGNQFYYKVVESDSTQQTSDIKNTDLNIIKNESGEDVMIQRQYIKESDSPYDVTNEANMFETFEPLDIKESDSTDDLIEAIKENAESEPVISDEDEDEIKEALDVLGKIGFDAEKYRERITNPTPDKDQNNYGVNHVTIITPEGVETSIYEADEYSELVEYVIDSVSSETTKKSSIGENIDPETQE